MAGGCGGDTELVAGRDITAAFSDLHAGWDQRQKTLKDLRAQHFIHFF